ncbi:MAG: metallophosphoesterase [Polyangiales bacterium]
MVRIAQLSDFHLVESGHQHRRGVRSFRLRFVSVHRTLDADDRAARVRRALARAKDLAADHYVITGDVTEDGTTAQFELLAGLLHDSGIAPSKVTLVPGNHDAIDRPDGWARALEGPLAPWAHASRPGEEVVVGDVAIVPVDTSVHQHWVFSSGRLAPAHAAAVEGAVARNRRAGRAVAMVQHHPVMPYAMPLVQWVDGMHGHRRTRSVLADEEHVHVIHGHVHRAGERAMATSRRPQVFSAPAVVDGDDPVRVYTVEGGALRAA